MGTRDPRIDDYIAKSADFAQPILTHIGEVVHAACPDVREAMKWSMPHFDDNGSLAGKRRRSQGTQKRERPSTTFRPASAATRLAQAVEWAGEGKARNWNAEHDWYA